MFEESINLDDLDDINEESAPLPLSDDSALIRCGRYLSLQAKKHFSDKAITSGQTSETTGISCIADDITEDQKRYIDLLATGMSSIMVCESMNMDIFLPTLWEKTLDKDSTFMQCLQLVKEKQADALEDHVWDQALHNNKSPLLKMFALKARKDEYKDNALPQSNVQTNILVTISDQQGNIRPYVVDTRIAPAEEVKRG